MNDEIAFAIFLLCLIGAILLGILGFGYSIDNVPLRVYLDGKEVFHGRSACVDTKSIGSSSQVGTHKGPFCLFPKEYFAGHNLVIKTEKNED